MNNVHVYNFYYNMYVCIFKFVFFTFVFATGAKKGTIAKFLVCVHIQGIIKLILMMKGLFSKTLFVEICSNSAEKVKQICGGSTSFLISKNILHCRTVDFLLVYSNKIISIETSPNRSVQSLRDCIVFFVSTDFLNMWFEIGAI